MSLYNMLFGINGWSDLVLALLNMRESDVERFRNCGIDFESKTIGITARTGGGNREDYPNKLLTSHPLYKCDYDDDFDCSYVHYEFKFPEDIADDIAKLENIGENGIPASIVNRYNEVRNREETDGDKYRREYEYQCKYVNIQMNAGNIKCYNGWIYVPLNDYGMITLLNVMESAEGSFHLGDIGLGKLDVKVGCVSNNNGNRVVIELMRDVDVEYFEYVINKYEKRYPNAIEVLKQNIYL